MVSRGLLAFCGLLLCCVACHRGPRPPVEITADEDRCEVCRMAVSQKPFAAQVMQADGTPLFFDDIGCLVEFVRSPGLSAGALAYVVDFNTGEWLSSEQASYLWSKTLPTPMSYGLAAFSASTAAGAHAQQYPGQVLTWERLLKEWKP